MLQNIYFLNILMNKKRNETKGGKIGPEEQVAC